MFAKISRLYKLFSAPIVAAGLFAASPGSVFAQSAAPGAVSASSVTNAPAESAASPQSDAAAGAIAHDEAHAAVTAVSTDVKVISTDDAPPADLNLGGQTILTLHTSVGNLTPKERIDVIEQRLVRILGIPRITPDDVAVYTPTGKPPVIYAVGRKLITVDAATAREEAAAPPLDVATIWAKRFQQILPFVDYRLPGDPEPVVPPDPPLTVTDDQTRVGGQMGDVVWGKDLIMRLRGIQHDTTAAERADVVTDRMQLLLHRVGNDPGAISTAPGRPEKVAVVTQVAERIAPSDAPAAAGSKIKTISSTASASVKTAATVQLLPTAIVKIGSTPLITVTTADATAAQQPSPDALAASWAKNLRQALLPEGVLPHIPAPAAPASADPAPAAPEPSAAKEAPLLPAIAASTTVKPDANTSTVIEFQAAPMVPPPTDTDPVAAPAPVPSSTVGLVNDVRIRLHTPLPFRQRRKLFI